jgi:gluconokinase
MDVRTGRFVVMGVSGVGKTRTGSLLAEALGGSFIEGDDLHPDSNRARMAAGHPLTDDDRWPWLDRVGAALAQPDPPVVAACSALRRRYRDRLRDRVPGLVFLHLVGDPTLVRTRLAARQGHFMPPTLLQSQYGTLEPLTPDELGLEASVEGPTDEVLVRLLDGITRL